MEQMHRWAGGPGTAGVMTAVVATARNGVIGRGGALPWKLPDDMAHFRAVTRGGVLIHGRGVWDELGRKRLPGRSHVVLSRREVLMESGVRSAATPQEALDLCREWPVYLVGGAQVYAALGDAAQFVWVTQVHADVEGDVTLAPFSGGFRLVSLEYRPADADHAYARSFRLLQRVPEGGRSWAQALVWGRE